MKGLIGFHEKKVRNGVESTHSAVGNFTARCRMTSRLRSHSIRHADSWKVQSARAIRTRKSDGCGCVPFRLGECQRRLSRSHPATQSDRPAGCRCVCRRYFLGTQYNKNAPASIPHGGLAAQKAKNRPAFRKGGRRAYATPPAVTPSVTGARQRARGELGRSWVTRARAASGVPNRNLDTDKCY